MHTTHSDGVYTPEQVVDIARQKDLRAIAVTDHDILSGIEVAKQAARGTSLEIIPGVEISTLWNDQEIHMLGYFVDVHNPKLRRALEKQREARQERNQLMIEKLVKLGIEITEEEVQEKKPVHDRDTNIGRPHIAEVLIEKGIVHTMNEAFEKYLGKNGMAYLTPKRISPIDAIRLIRESNGVAVVAHPGLYQQDELLPVLIEAGLEGIEVHHPDHSAEDQQKYTKIAQKYGLIATAGSDFHGERNGLMHHADLGTCTVAYEQVKKLKQR